MSRRVVTIGLAVAISVAAWSSPAHARRRGLVIVTWGESIDHVASLPIDVADDLREETGHALSVGYMYSSFGLFWLDVWSWGGTYVLYDGDSYYEVTDEEVAALAGVDSADDLGKPWKYRFPPGLILVAALVIGGVLFARAKRRAHAELDAMYGGPPAEPSPEVPEAKARPPKPKPKPVVNVGPSKPVEHTLAQDRPDGPPSLLK